MNSSRRNSSKRGGSGRRGDSNRRRGYSGARNSSTKRARGRSGGRREQKRHQGAYIDPRKFVSKAVTPQEEVSFDPEHKFTDFGFITKIEANLAKKGYTNPTPIQDGAIPHIMAGKDIIGLANTGTGKTAAFALPTIHKIKTSKSRETALILAPTRELAVQIDEEFRMFGAGLGVYTALCVGGVGINSQKSVLKRHPQVIIATPGRLIDLVKQGAINLQYVTIFVLDEADRMLDMGFINDINFVVDKLPKNRQSLCLSATITPDIEKLMKKLLKEPVTVSVRKGATSDNVEQDVVIAGSVSEKMTKLKGLLSDNDFDKVLVFGRTKWGVQKLARILTKDGFPSEAIHGNKTQPQRQRSLQAFKKGKVKVLVATDVAARGLDIPNVSHVINYDQPNTYEDYVHRIGRTGRAGNKGHALTFVSPENILKIKNLPK